MMEDFWLPRREGGKGTEITTLPGGQNLGELEDVKYFQKKLYGALNVPVSRLETNQGFSLGRTSEITRDEIKFSKFVDRMRNKFSDLFDQAMRVQCVLKGICTAEEWEEFKENIYYDFIKDNNFNELKEAELIKERLSLLQSVDPYTGRYFSQKWIQQNVLRLTDDQIAEMQKQIDEEKEAGLGLPVEITNNVAQQQMSGEVQAQQQMQMAQDQADMQQDSQAQDQSSNPANSGDKKKTPSTRADLSLESNTFTKLKRIL
jgi:hypothetical protein